MGHLFAPCPLSACLALLCPSVHFLPAWHFSARPSSFCPPVLFLPIRPLSARLALFCPPVLFLPTRPLSARLALFCLPGTSLPARPLSAHPFSFCPPVLFLPAWHFSACLPDPPSCTATMPEAQRKRPGRSFAASRYVDEQRKRKQKFADLNIAQCAFAGLYIPTATLAILNSDLVVERFKAHTKGGLEEISRDDLDRYCSQLDKPSQITTRFGTSSKALLYRMLTDAPSDILAYLISKDVNDEMKENVERSLEAIKADVLKIAKEVGALEVVTQHQPQAGDRVVKPTKRKLSTGIKANHAQPLEDTVERSHRQSENENGLARKAKRKHGQQVDLSPPDEEHRPSSRSRNNEDIALSVMQARPGDTDTVTRFSHERQPGDTDTAARSSHERQTAVPSEISGDPASNPIIDTPAFPVPPGNYGMIHERAEVNFPGTATFAPNLFWSNDPSFQDTYLQPSLLWDQD
ncbi:uncharacterized protein B0I36DRAFT_354259 [Microdochium trichocladiopsis]|uniref:Uncharacterized protein n=1 Tax=Microdochium trichocladiopsis TaxID=1682393 RepID=A0A9P9BIJ2_9PEZI|nr:uncharacterized protein B0I36DRAFT_354259 [Microdochium trichocladiopsis]KAH7021640.1 hypothetical protein B0I36DRAFT_354259 [Microdochium trichocladiopsis]